MIALVAKNLYDITENIAEKEIEKDPLDFIRRESSIKEANESSLFYTCRNDINI